MSSDFEESQRPNPTLLTLPQENSPRVATGADRENRIPDCPMRQAPVGQMGMFPCLRPRKGRKNGWWQGRNLMPPQTDSRCCSSGSKPDQFAFPPGCASALLAASARTRQNRVWGSLRGAGQKSHAPSLPPKQIGRPPRLRRYRGAIARLWAAPRQQVLRRTGRRTATGRRMPLDGDNSRRMPKLCPDWESRTLARPSLHSTQAA